MADRATIAQQTAAGLRRYHDQAPDVPVMLGFDGFVDSIIDVVDKRHDVEQYAPIDTIETFGGRISAAAGQSANFELVVKQRKLGGNGPIMANAMAAAGFGVTYIGALGTPQVDPVFRELTERATVYSVLANGATDALEFNDGKLLLGKYDHLAEMTYERICEHVGEAQFTELVGRSRLIGAVNWTMLTRLETIWDALTDRVLPAAARRSNGNDEGPPYVFADLCDPQKRTESDLKQALASLGRLNHEARVVLGLNLKESTHIAEAMNVAVTPDDEADLAVRAQRLREALDLNCVVVHSRRAAGAAVQNDNDSTQQQSAAFVGPFVYKPYLSTGAGDNFNAGFCLGLLAGLPLEQALCAGTATSGYYVRQGASPTLAELAEFCDQLPAPEDA